MSVKLAVVDLAGTTVRENGIVEQAARAAVEEVRHVDPGRFTERFHRARGGSKRDMFRALVGDPGLAEAAHDLFEQDLEQRVRTGAVSALPGASTALGELRERGMKVALTTGFSARVRDALVDHLGWRDRVDLVLSPGEGGRGRPHPDLVLTAVLRLRIDAVQHVAVAGDTVNDLLAGTRAGARIVAAVLGGAHSREELARAPHTHILDGIGELPRAIAELST